MLIKELLSTGELFIIGEKTKIGTYLVEKKLFFQVFERKSRWSMIAPRLLYAGESEEEAVDAFSRNEK